MADDVAISDGSDILNIILTLDRAYILYIYMICVDHRKLEIDWTNCVGFASDNCNTMIEARNLVSQVRERQPRVYSLGCICHLADLWVKAGMKWSLPSTICSSTYGFTSIAGISSSTICCPHLYWFNCLLKSNLMILTDNYAKIICCTKQFTHVRVEFLVPRGKQLSKLIKIKHVTTFGLATRPR